MLGIIANTVLLTMGCDNKVESRRRSSVIKICATTLVAMVVASRSTFRHVPISFFSRCMPKAVWRENPQQYRAGVQRIFP